MFSVGRSSLNDVFFVVVCCCFHCMFKGRLLRNGVAMSSAADIEMSVMLDFALTQSHTVSAQVHGLGLRCVSMGFFLFQFHY